MAAKKGKAKAKRNGFSDPEYRDTFWHSSAHIMAAAVEKLFPKARMTIGPAIEIGFYYDFYTDKPFTPDDLKAIEKEMRKIIEKNEPFVCEKVSKEKAKELFNGNKFKVELIDEYKDEQLSIYKTGDFFDLCRGPHVKSTGEIKAVKLIRSSNAYWRGDSTKESLQRIYGVAFTSEKELKDYLQKIEEAKKRDHRKLLKDLELAMFHEVAPGAAFFLPKGTIIYNELKKFLREEYKKSGYIEVMTPQMFNKKLWEISGHWEHYKDEMYLLEIDKTIHSLKPMNCPSNCLIYNSKVRSYKDLPIRLADFGFLHRKELSGVLTGMARVIRFSQDDAHVFCALEQVEEEVLEILKFIKYIWEDIFGFKINYYLATRPDKKMGSDEVWDKAEKMLENALKKAKIKYTLKEGEGVFYGPKIDIDVEDVFGRKWQCPTCQLDFNMPNRFKCMYDGEDGKKHECVIIHRAILGSFERFFAIMLEHFGGNLPLWVSPVQVAILPIADRHIKYCKKIAEQMKEKGIRVEVNSHVESVGKKIRGAQLQKINYILVVGDKELKGKNINVRTRDGKVHGEQKTGKFIEKVLKEIREKKRD